MANSIAGTCLVNRKPILIVSDDNGTHCVCNYSGSGREYCPQEYTTVMQALQMRKENEAPTDGYRAP